MQQHISVLFSHLICPEASSLAQRFLSAAFYSEEKGNKRRKGWERQSRLISNVTILHSQELLFILFQFMKLNSAPWENNKNKGLLSLIVKAELTLCLSASTIRSRPPLLLSCFFEALKASPTTETSTWDWKMWRQFKPLHFETHLACIQYSYIVFLIFIHRWSSSSNENNKPPNHPSRESVTLTNFLLWNR